MKPRLESAALTVEDWKILCDMRQYHERWRGSNLLAMSSESDRRDADLMLHLRVAYGDVSADERRQSHRYRRVCHCAWAFTNLPYGPMP